MGKFIPFKKRSESVRTFIYRLYSYAIVAYDSKITYDSKYSYLTLDQNDENVCEFDKKQLYHLILFLIIPSITSRQSFHERDIDIIT